MMLKAFTLQNFRSFKEPVRISLELSQHAPDDHRSCESPAGTRLSKAIAVIGANASGKTTLVKSLVFVDRFMKRSFHAEPDEPLPFSPHFSAAAEDSSFELEFELDDREWRYQLVASRGRVKHESLYAKPKHSRAFSYVFTREWQPERKGYAVKQRQFGLLQKEAEKVRENASLISTAAQYQVDLALKLVSTTMLSSVRPLDQSKDIAILRASDFYAKNTDIQSQMTSLLRQWDFGLADVRMEKMTRTQERSDESPDIHFPFGIHRVGDKEHSLAFFNESSGTQSAFILLSRILPILQSGGAPIIIDELEADLHPHMMRPILDLFFSPKTNPHNVQIIFTCHSIEVLSLLHKAQVVLVEKDGNCVSDAWRLDSVKGVRSDDNLYAKYMAGAYGAIPRL
ncbi:AAA family ATPase [Verminephrobacter aporrectodeae]|uniref:AAA family ATPase n=1 Tax=Verminephrobacter aporrectodeae TaxID=1110389 RepID=UPI002243480F|nr:ATP-binding protein [Verminephrobacter aporrectodeae]MCW8175504.1 ATP-binding protein [Verminephrobacter aporrectodeae subsp. tuberculatae]MCW8202989.1 ATP-binding protein [Verminephrobacter aporrectodeae subsp. tuberculatae]